MKRLTTGVIILLALVTGGCGGGGGSQPIIVATNSAVIYGVSASLTNYTSINYIKVSATLPPGVFPVISSGRNLKIGEAGLKCLKNNATIILGRYSSTTNEVVFDLLSNPINTDMGTGDLARLTYTVAPGTTVNDASFSALPPTYLVRGSGGRNFSWQFTPNQRLTTYPRP